MLESHLHVDTAQGGFGLSMYFQEGNITFTDRFVRLFLSSIANNFAGLEIIPVEAIMIFIRKHKHIRSRILKYLQDAPDIVSKALAETMFKAAIEAGDLTVIRFLLENQLVDPNNVVIVEYGNRRLTPVEKAASLRQLEIIRCLVEAGADVNRTYAEARSRFDKGALECAIRQWGEYVSIDLNLVRIILQAGATVRAELLEATIRWGDESVVAELMSMFPPTEHTHCLEVGLWLMLPSILATT